MPIRLRPSIGLLPLSLSSDALPAFVGVPDLEPGPDVGTLLKRGWTDMGRSEELSESVFMAKPGERGGSGCMIGSCAEAERRYDGLGATSESSSESGGSRLRRFPSFAPSSNLRASIRLWAANASNGERSGGISPATCKRGDGNGRANASLLAPSGPWE